jgi:PAS domain S-box-containing protein
MAIQDEVFYFYGTAGVDGVLQKAKGKGLDDLTLGSNISTTKHINLADRWLGDLSVFTRIKDAIAKAAGGQAVTIEVELPSTDETAANESSAEKSKHLKLTLSPVAESGVTKEIEFAALDISAQMRETEFYRNRSEQLFFAAETAEIGLFFWDLNKEELFTTPRFNELYGLGPDEIMTRDKFSRVVHPEDIGLVNDTIRRSHSNFGECNTEYRVTVNGEQRWIWIRGKTFPGTENTAAFTMGSGRDITESKTAEKEITKLLAVEKKYRDEVEQAVRAKDNFIAIISHELRAPLNSILGWVKILLTKDVSDETRTSALETIERSARVQAKLIGDLVDSSKIISGKLNLEFHPVRVPEAIGYVVESQKPVAEAKNIRLQYTCDDESITVHADLARLQQIFTNLLTNAIKFTPEGGRVTVDCEQIGDEVSISVEDTGKGIAPEELPHIFERYFQGRVSDSVDKSGLGLGLSIVSSLVRQHGGSVRAESRGIGAGAKFIVTLPALTVSREVEDEQKTRAELSEEPLQDMRILLIEDNDDSREVLQIFFEQRGAKVAPASSVAEALFHLYSDRNLPHVVVSDISMPGEDGFSFIRKLRSLPSTRGGSIPAIALTALVSAENERKLLAAGFQYHHPKPFEADRLIDEILACSRANGKVI